MKKCEKCGLEFPDASRFCKSCGGQLADTAPAASEVPSGETCSACNAVVQPNWKFCKYCGHRSDETTVVSTRQASPVPEAHTATSHAPAAALPASAPASHSAELSAPTTYKTPGIAPAFQPINCAACGHENHAGRTTCESCGAALVPVKDRRRVKKAGMIAAIVLGALLVFAAVAAGGVYFLGSTVTVQTNPGDATILIDGREAGRTDANGAFSIKRIRPGDHSLVIKREGFVEWKQTFNISFAEMKKGLNIKLEPVLWKLTVVTTPPGADVVVDDKPAGSTGYSDGKLVVPDLKPGDHTLIVRQPGYLEWKQTVKLSADQSIQVTLTTEPVVDPTTPEGAIRSALGSWAAATRSRDVDQVMGYYGDVLTYYYDRSSVPKSSVRDAYTTTFGKYNQVEVQLNNIAVVLDAAGGSATVTYDKTYNYQGTNNASLSGSQQLQLTMTKTGDAWLITGEKKLKDY